MRTGRSEADIYEREPCNLSAACDMCFSIEGRDTQNRSKNTRCTKP
jgi:hypothetical protein